MNLYEEITKQGYKIEKMRSYSNNNRVYIINESNERIGYYRKMEGTRTKIILKGTFLKIVEVSRRRYHQIVN